MGAGEISRCVLRRWADLLLEMTGHAYSLRPAFNVPRFEQLRVTPVERMIPSSIGGRGNKLSCYITWCPLSLTKTVNELRDIYNVDRLILPKSGATLFQR